MNDRLKNLTFGNGSVELNKWDLPVPWSDIDLNYPSESDPGDELDDIFYLDTDDYDSEDGLDFDGYSIDSESIVFHSDVLRHSKSPTVIGNHSSHADHKSAPAGRHRIPNASVIPYLGTNEVVETNTEFEIVYENDDFNELNNAEGSQPSSDRGDLRSFQSANLGWIHRDKRKAHRLIGLSNSTLSDNRDRRKGTAGRVGGVLSSDGREAGPGSELIIVDREGPRRRLVKTLFLFGGID